MSTLARLTMAVTVLMVAGCASTPPQTQQSPTVNVTGNWVGEWVCDRPEQGSGVMMMKLTQSGSQVTGSSQVTNTAINRTTEGLTGSVSGDQFNIQSYQDVKGSLTVSGDKMSGHMMGVLCGGNLAMRRDPWAGTGERSRLTTMSATVAAVDPANRIVTLRSPNGDLTTLQVSEEVRNLPQVSVGDIVTVAYYQSWALRLGEPPTTTTTVTGRAAPGQMPAAYSARRTNIKATVVATDPGKPSVTFKGSTGNQVEVDVSDDPRVLSRLKVGETYDVSYTESTAVAVTKAPR